MPHIEHNRFSPEPTEDQMQWLDAMEYCDLMEGECLYNKDTVGAKWWGAQADACYSRVQKGIPYADRG